MPLWEVLDKMRHRPISVDKSMHLFSGMDSIRKPTGQKASCPRPLSHQYNFWLQNSGSQNIKDLIGGPVVKESNSIAWTHRLFMSAMDFWRLKGYTILLHNKLQKG